mmetsp:Transcript_75972/g.203672  ORF Transcript_75972/g.203672 Transcript_75972/m.203672 type:complete len:86 (-) Transcript_75972:161-418(-)
MSLMIVFSCLVYGSRAGCHSTRQFVACISKFGTCSLGASAGLRVDPDPSGEYPFPHSHCLSPAAQVALESALLLALFLLELAHRR